MEFKLTLSAEQISIVGKYLGTGAYNEVAALVQHIQAQVDAQLQDAQATEAPVAETAAR